MAIGDPNQNPFTNPYLLGSYNANTGVTATQPYGQSNTDSAVSQIYADAFRNASLPYQLSGTNAPGTSIGANNMAGAATRISGILGNAGQAAANQQLGDASANANSLLGGQDLNARTALSLGNLQSGQNNMLFNQGVQNQQYNQRLLGSIFGNGDSSLLGSLMG